MSSEIARKVLGHFQTQTATASEVEKLSARERDVLEQVAHGFANKEIADRLNITAETVRWHLKHIFQKLHVRSRTEAAMKLRPLS
jgi:DNA-binding NarL/FixJ family response regulator